MKKSSSEWLKPGKTVIQHLREKMILCFCVLPASAEALVRRGGKVLVNYRLIAYLISNISGQSYQKLWTYVEQVGYGPENMLIFLWPPNTAGIIFCSCGFFFFLLSSPFSLPILSGRRLDVYHILSHMMWP